MYGTSHLRFRQLTGLFGVLLWLLAGTACGLTITRTVVVTATPRATVASSTVSPQMLALSASDVPGDFLQTASRFHSNAQVADDYGLSLAALNRRGRITSFETEYKRRDVSGILLVDDIVAAWTTPAGARWDYRHVLREIGHPATRRVEVRDLDADHLGNQRTAFSFQNANQPADLADYLIVFRRGSYRVYLAIVAVTGTIGDQEALRLARIIDRRIPGNR